MFNFKTWAEYNPAENAGFLSKKQKGKPTLHILEEFGTLDTETSHNHAEDRADLVCWIYQWAFYFDGELICGRKPSELIKALKKIIEAYNLGKSKKAVFYIHNLSYDLPYIRRYLEEAFGKGEYLALDPNEFLYYENDYFIFRCSYKLANRSLEVWGDDLGTEHRKGVGLVDYEKIHTQDEELTLEDWEYMGLDVIVQHECIEKQMKLFGDDILSIPLTSTGYVRREFRTAFQNSKYAKLNFRKTALEPREYDMLEKEYSGGYTHGNRFKANKVVKGNIRHRDFRSHYPSQIGCRKFPTGRITLWGEDCNLEEVKTLINNDYYVYLEIEVTDFTIKGPHITFPSVSYSSCVEGGSTVIEASCDNGRVLSMKGTTTLYMDMYDFRWFCYCYKVNKGNLKIKKVWRAKQAYLKDSPEKYIWDITKKYYLEKTKYKQLEKKARKDGDKEAEENAHVHLQLAKALLNAIYGCLAMKCVRPVLNEDEWWQWAKKETFELEEEEELLGKYYSKFSSCTRFEFGCAITSMARDELFTLIYHIIGSENVLYCDTDSCFYISTPAIEARIEAYNEKCRKKAMELNAYIVYDGKTVTFDSFDDEEEDITEFSFLHAKCYAYNERKLDKDGNNVNELHCTIAGVNRNVVVGIDDEGKPIRYTREEELGSIENLHEGRKFINCGGLSGIHLNAYPFEYNGQECSGGVVLSRTTKKLTYKEESHLSRLGKCIYNVV